MGDYVLGGATETYIFKSQKHPQIVNELSKFEEDLMSMIKNIEIRNVTDLMDLTDVMDQVQRNKAYTSVKDHKQNFQTNSSFILINPAKANILDKTILVRIYLH